MSCLISQVIPAPSSRQPLSLHNCASELVPPVLCYYVTALLVLIPRTFPIRLPLLPITLWAAFHAATRLDLAAGYGNDQRLAYMNHGFLLVITTLAIRASIWTFQLQPYERHQSTHKPKQSTRKPKPVHSSTGQLFLDALDLTINLRGLGWTWSHGLRIPRETRALTYTRSFLLSTLLSCLAHIILFDIAHYSMQAFGPNTLASATGGSIYASSLPPFVRYARSSLITLLAGFTVYCGMQSVYLLFTLVCVGLFGQDPRQWPPAFEKPWLSTSLNQFWSRRWHQILRDSFFAFGGKPLALFIGRPGGIVGAFLASGMTHNIGLWGMGRGSDFWSVAGFFLMMGIGIILERVWRAATGERVGGFAGWLWTMLWVVGWANMLVEAWSIRGLVGSTFAPNRWRPSTLLFGSLFES